MKISYVSPSDQSIASFRYRVLIPAGQLKHHELYVDAEPEEGADITVFSKHWAANIPFAQTAKGNGSVIVYDICDDHFEDHLRFEYKAMINRADVITCNSEAMRDRIKEKTGRDSHVIPDPYEMPYKAAEFSPDKTPKCLWFGHSTNIPSLEKIPLVGDLEIITNCPEPRKEGPITWTPYTQRALIDGMDKADIVLIPQDKPCKSANRVIEALRRGKFVIASGIPSYLEFEPYIFMATEPEDFKNGVYWALHNPDDALERIKGGQEFVKKFAPKEIGGMWDSVFTSSLFKHAARGGING